MELIEAIRKELELIHSELEKIKEFTNIEIYEYNSLNEAQIGYSIDSNGNSLVEPEEGSWDSNWVVFGYETRCGDPIVMDLGDKGFPVFSLMHGMGSWEGGTTLADSINLFYKTILTVSLFIKEKNLFECKKLTNKELKLLENDLLLHISNYDLEVWQSMLSPLYNIAKDYDKELIEEIKKLKSNGVKIADIAKELTIPVKDVYKYFEELK